MVELTVVIALTGIITTFLLSMLIATNTHMNNDLISVKTTSELRKAQVFFENWVRYNDKEDVDFTGTSVDDASIGEPAGYQLIPQPTYNLANLADPISDPASSGKITFENASDLTTYVSNSTVDTKQHFEIVNGELKVTGTSNGWNQGDNAEVCGYYTQIAVGSGNTSISFDMRLETTLQNNNNNAPWIGIKVGSDVYWAVDSSGKNIFHSNRSAFSTMSTYTISSTGITTDNAASTLTAFKKLGTNQFLNNFIFQFYYSTNK